jgi:hypothetical protein
VSQVWLARASPSFPGAAFGFGEAVRELTNGESSTAFPVDRDPSGHCKDQLRTVVVVSVVVFVWRFAADVKIPLNRGLDGACPPVLGKL